MGIADQLNNGYPAYTYSTYLDGPEPFWLWVGEAVAVDLHSDQSWTLPFQWTRLFKT